MLLLLLLKFETHKNQVVVMLVDGKLFNLIGLIPWWKKILIFLTFHKRP